VWNGRGTFGGGGGAVYQLQLLRFLFFDTIQNAFLFVVSRTI
jgi:hypothetical protein